MTEFLSQRFSLEVIALSPSDVLMVLLNMDLLITGLILLPFLLILAIYYIRPALYEKERSFLRFVPMIYVLSMAGLAAGWFLSIEIFIPYFMGFSKAIGVVNNWSLVSLMFFVLLVCVIFLVIFNTPVVFITLFNLQVLKIKDIVMIRKVVILISFIFGAIFSPPDIVSQCVVALPMYLFFELTAQYCLMRERFRKKTNLAVEVPQ